MGTCNNKLKGIFKGRTLVKLPTDLNLTGGDEKQKQNIYSILVWHKTQTWFKIIPGKF